MLERVQRGLYVLPDEWPDELYALSRRFSKGVYRAESALDLFGLTERRPEKIRMAFPAGYNVSSARAAGIDAKTYSRGFEEGIEYVDTMFGNTVRTHKPERALCELLLQDSDPADEAFAFRTYFSEPRFRNLEASTSLARYAEEYGVELGIRSYRRAFTC